MYITYITLTYMQMFMCVLHVMGECKHFSCHVLILSSAALYKIVCESRIFGKDDDRKFAMFSFDLSGLEMQGQPLIHCRQNTIIRFYK